MVLVSQANGGNHPLAGPGPLSPPTIPPTGWGVGWWLLPVAMLLSGSAGTWVLLPLLTIPIAYRAASAILGGLSGPALNIMLARSGKLQLLYALLLAVGMVLG